jgi:hypothetical protein
MSPIVGLVPPPPFPVWVTLKQTADNVGALSFGHGVILGLGIIATFLLCALAIWFKRWIVRRLPPSRYSQRKLPDY